MNNSIRNAIHDKKIIEFDYDGHHRIAEPHVQGISNDQYETLIFQIGGGSKSGGIPDWRRIKVDQITNLRVTEQRFNGRRPFPSGKHSPFDTTFDVVGP